MNELPTHEMLPIPGRDIAIAIPLHNPCAIIEMSARDLLAIQAQLSECEKARCLAVRWNGDYTEVISSLNAQLAECRRELEEANRMREWHSACADEAIRQRATCTLDYHLYANRMSCKDCA
jgi:hypothetical protein